MGTYVPLRQTLVPTSTSLIGTCARHRGRLIPRLGYPELSRFPRIAWVPQNGKVQRKDNVLYSLEFLTFPVCIIIFVLLYFIKTNSNSLLLKVELHGYGRVTDILAVTGSFLLHS
uniref:Uncharacterized protein n=1 Tax=Cacopsylla melanoneura TaxID=428564 RepID=A0A8D8XPL0_9HEMI